MLNFCDTCGDQSQASFTGEKPPYVCIHCKFDHMKRLCAVEIKRADAAEARVKELEFKLSLLSEKTKSKIMEKLK